MKYKGNPAEANERIQVELFKLMNKGVEWVELELKTRRNPKFHRKFFAFCKIIAEKTNQEIEAVRSVVTVKAGHFKSVVLNEDYTYYYPDSISFASMSEDEFREFYEKAVNSAFLIWDIDKETIKQLKDF